MRLFNVKLAIGLGIVSFALSGVTLAEEAKEEVEAFDLGQVVVTATRTEREIGNVPATVTVITREEIEQSNAKNAFDLLRTTPGVCIEDSYGIGMQGRVSIRGLNPFGSKYVLVLVDGVVVNEGDNSDVNWGTAIPPVQDIERIEVLKGSASALYGGSAMGGVINIITKSGPKEPETEVGVSFGGYREKISEVTTGGTSGRVNYRLSANYREGDGHRHHSDHRRKGIFAKASFAPDDQSELTFDISSAEQYYDLAGGLTEAQYKADPTQCTAPLDSVDLRTSRSSLRYERAIDEYKRLKATLWVFEKKYEDYMTFYGSLWDYLSHLHTMGTEVQYELERSLLDRPNSLLLGVMLRDDKTEYQKYKATNKVKGKLYDDNQTRGFSWSLFVQDEFQVLEPLTLNAGVRYDSVRYDYTERITTSESGEKSFDEYSPKVGLIYRVMDKLSLFANYSEAFKSPTCSHLFSSTYANPNLEPEIAINKEVGMRAQILENLSLKISRYWMKVKDEIISVTTATETSFQNAGEVRHKGIESEIEYRPLKNLTTFLNLTHQSVKFTDYTDKYGTYDGNWMPHCPEWRLSSGIRYEHPVGLICTLGVNWVDEQHANNKNTYDIPGYVVWNTRLDYEKDWWSVYLAVNNLFDEDYYEQRTSSGSIYPSPGQTFMGGMKIKF